MVLSREFRAQLREELPVWLADGIVTPGAARALVSRFELENPDGVSRAAQDHAAAVAGAGAIGATAALALAFAPSLFREGALLPLAAGAAALSAAPLVLRGDALAPAAATLRGVGRGVFYLVAFALSFVQVSGSLHLQTPASPGFLAALPLFVLALVAVVAGLRRPDVDAHARGEAMLLSATVLAFAAGLFLETGTGTAVVANLALAFLAAGRIVRGVSWLARSSFWEGLLLAAVLAASRIVDVAVPGWPRFTGAFLVAAGATAAGLLFERHRSRTPHEARVHVA